MGELRQIAIVSGKGGTGKTSVVASFAALADGVVLADCDVDAANLHLLLAPSPRAREEFWGAKVVVRDPERCQKGGPCASACRFDAITAESLNELACEGCGACVVACPNGALSLEPALTGECLISDTAYGTLVHANLYPGAESSGRLVTLVRQRAEEEAMAQGRSLVLIDGAPGIGCVASAALTETDLAIIVTEPTLSGMHDMERIMDLAGHFGLPMAVIINKSDINPVNTGRIRRSCGERGATVLAELPFDDLVARALAARMPIVEHSRGPVAQALEQAWERLLAWRPS